VLAIAAAKALQIRVLASDIDAPSVKVAAENARLNGVGPLVEVTKGAGFSAPLLRQRKPFDLVLANILANPLRQMATPLSQHLARNARVILSGLLSAQAPAVIAAYRARGLILERQIRIEGWSSLLLYNTRAD
jgi:ribosomal protein L11 methyltransferase